VAAYLLKPIRQAELREAIARILGSMAERRKAQMITSPILVEARPVSSSLEILLAEDNEVNRKLATRLLEKRGHSVDVATNGREALEALRARTYDLVLMDVQMPEMDGVAATAALRASEAETGRHQPVIAMTALVMKGDRERCMAVGMDGYLAKPIRAQELDEVLEKYIALKNDVDVPQQAPSQAASTAEEMTIDAQDLMERVSDDREFLAELVGIFKEDGPRQLESIKKALEEQNREEMRRAAHSLRGALSNLAAVRASALAADIEFAGTLGDFSSAHTALHRLEVELTRVIDTLSAICQEAVS
jgi:CheY-like chemotaxis protein